MKPTSSSQVWVATGLIALSIGCFLPSLGLAANINRETLVEKLRQDAEKHEKEGRWDLAYDCYDTILGFENRADIKQKRHLCLRHIWQNNRHRDPVYREKILALDLPKALDVYEDLLDIIENHYPDREKVSIQSLFQQGIEEVWFALGNEAFRQERLSGTKADAIETFRKEWRASFQGKTVKKNNIRQLLREAAFAAKSALRVDPTVIVMEFACGACNSLDEHSFYLTPRDLADEIDSFKADFAGIGIKAFYKDRKLYVLEVVPGSEADKAGIRENDQILHINHKEVAKLSPETALEMLKGEPGAMVDLEVAGNGMEEPRTVKLRAMAMPTVVDEAILDDDGEIGYLRLTGFQKNTLQDLDSAILRLRSQGMKALILDLRGNGGGLFRVAIQVAERFLPTGIITSTKSPIRSQNKIYESHSGMSALRAEDLPMVVLIDGDTASSAEVLAGALQENGRAILIGQATYGKASIQRVLQVNAAPAGIRITLARYFSPQGKDYSGVGVTPDILVELLNGMDAQKVRAIQVAGEATRQMPKRP